MSDKYNDEIVEMEDGDEILETQESTDVDVTHDTASEYAEPVETTGEAEKDEAPQADEKTAAFIDLITAPDYVVVNRNLGLWASKRAQPQHLVVQPGGQYIPRDLPGSQGHPYAVRDVRRP